MTIENHDHIKMKDKPKNPFEIKVECYSGYRAEETPRYLWFYQHKIRVIEVIDRWLSPEHRYFKVLGDDHSIYIIRHDSLTWRWELTFFKQLSKKTNTPKPPLNEKNA